MRGSQPAPGALLYAVKRLELAIRAQLDETLRGSGVTTLQYTALTVLQRRDAISAAQLARASFVTPQSMSDMLRALEQRSLVRRSRNPASRRELLVHLTPQGRALLDAHAHGAAAIEAQMTSGWDKSGRAAFAEAVREAHSRLDHPSA